MQDEKIREAELQKLRDEIHQLRVELWRQWWENHAEHCDTRWPHDGQRCAWPFPAILSALRVEDTQHQPSSL